jgi:hypothetical protein
MREDRSRVELSMQIKSQNSESDVLEQVRATRWDGLSHLPRSRIQPPGLGSWHAVQGKININSVRFRGPCVPSANLQTTSHNFSIVALRLGDRYHGRHYAFRMLTGLN